MRVKLRSFEVAIGIITVVSIAVLSFSSLWLAEDHMRQEKPSLHSRAKNGYQGIYLLIKNRFPRVVPGERSFNNLLTNERDILVTARSNWTSEESDAIRQWMDQGGVLIQITPLEEELGDYYAPNREAYPHSDWAGFHDLKLSLSDSPPLKLQNGDVAIYSSEYGPEVVVRRVGKGRRIILPAVNSLTNEQLRINPELGALFIKLLAVYEGEKKRIIWDESFNLTQADFSLKIPRYIYGIILQLIILSLFFTISYGRRLGPPKSLPTGQYLTLRDYLNSLSGFYRKTGSRRLVLEELYSDLRRRLLTVTGLSPSVDDSQLASAFANIRGIDSQRLARTLNDCRHAVKQSKFNEKIFYDLGKALDEYRKELDGYGSTK